MWAHFSDEINLIPCNSFFHLLHSQATTRHCIPPLSRSHGLVPRSTGSVDGTYIMLLLLNLSLVTPVIFVLPYKSLPFWISLFVGVLYALMFSGASCTPLIHSPANQSIAYTQTHSLFPSVFITFGNDDIILPSFKPEKPRINLGTQLPLFVISNHPSVLTSFNPQLFWPQIYFPSLPCLC